VARLLQPAQRHDLDQAADVQRPGRGVEPDITRHDTRHQRVVEPLHVGAVGQESAFDHHAEEI
jgi:hypothetical protein